MNQTKPVVLYVLDLLKRTGSVQSSMNKTTLIVLYVLDSKNKTQMSHKSHLFGNCID